jgi:hypothetical protein
VAVRRGPDDWIDTRINYALNPRDDGGTTLLFSHEGWQQQNEFMHGCSTNWAAYLISLKTGPKATDSTLTQAVRSAAGAEPLASFHDRGTWNARLAERQSGTSRHRPRRSLCQRRTRGRILRRGAALPRKRRSEHLYAITNTPRTGLPASHGCPGAENPGQVGGPGIRSVGTVP